jgi:hypothetical protein
MSKPVSAANMDELMSMMETTYLDLPDLIDDGGY